MVDHKGLINSLGVQLSKTIALYWVLELKRLTCEVCWGIGLQDSKLALAKSLAS